MTSNTAWGVELEKRKGEIVKLSTNTTTASLPHYHKIIIFLTETIRLMAEIDQVIESHGGWPGAFTNEKKTKS